MVDKGRSLLIMCGIGDGVDQGITYTTKTTKSTASRNG